MASSALSHHRSKGVLLQLWAASFLSLGFISLSGKLGEVETGNLKEPLWQACPVKPASFPHSTALKLCVPTPPLHVWAFLLLEDCAPVTPPGAAGEKPARARATMAAEPASGPRWRVLGQAEMSVYVTPTFSLIV